MDILPYQSNGLFYGSTHVINKENVMIKKSLLLLSISVFFVGYCSAQDCADRRNPRLGIQCVEEKLEEIKKILDEQNNSMPTGAIVAYYGIVAPDGWLMCDGRDVDSQYTELRKLVGNKTPNLQGYFLRGYDPSGAIDPDGPSRSIGKPQEQQLISHKHYRNDDSIEEYARNQEGVPGVDVTRGFINMQHEWKDYKVTTTGDPIDVNAGNETRPWNIAVNFIIKI